MILPDTDKAAKVAPQRIHAQPRPNIDAGFAMPKMHTGHLFGQVGIISEQAPRETLSRVKQHDIGCNIRQLAGGLADEKSPERHIATLDFTGPSSEFRGIENSKGLQGRHAGRAVT